MNKKPSKKWPEVWPGYETIEKLGRGGYGTVWKVRKVDPSGEYYSAVKKISIPSGEEEYAALEESGYGEDDITSIFKTRLGKIEDEFQLMEEFQGHSNIVSYQEHMEIEHEDEPGWDILIRMELLEPLGKCYDRFSEKEVVKLGRDICTALETIERKGIIHRDIKPSNILYSEKLGYYKLADFGIAKTMDHVTKGTMIGTADYIAPEVFNKEAYGFQADQYSLGLVLYWMLNKRKLPFIPLDHVPTDDELQTAKQKRVNGVPLPAPLHGSDKLKAVILKACAYDPADRYPDISAMKRELYSCLDIASSTLFKSINDDIAVVSDKPMNPTSERPPYGFDEDDTGTMDRFGSQKATDEDDRDYTVTDPVNNSDYSFTESDDDTETMGRFGKQKRSKPDNSNQNSSKTATGTETAETNKSVEDIIKDADFSDIFNALFGGAQAGNNSNAASNITYASVEEVLQKDIPQLSTAAASNARYVITPYINTGSIESILTDGANRWSKQTDEKIHQLIQDNRILAAYKSDYKVMRSGTPVKMLFSENTLYVNDDITSVYISGNNHQKQMGFHCDYRLITDVVIKKMYVNCMSKVICQLVPNTGNYSSFVFFVDEKFVDANKLAEMLMKLSKC